MVSAERAPCNCTCTDIVQFAAHEEPRVLDKGTTEDCYLHDLLNAMTIFDGPNQPRTHFNPRTTVKHKTSNNGGAGSSEHSGVSEEEGKPLAGREAAESEAISPKYTGIAGSKPVPLSPDALTAFSNGDPEAKQRNS